MLKIYLNNPKFLLLQNCVSSHAWDDPDRERLCTGATVHYISLCARAATRQCASFIAGEADSNFWQLGEDPTVPQSILPSTHRVLPTAAISCGTIFSSTCE